MIENTIYDVTRIVVCRDSYAFKNLIGGIDNVKHVTVRIERHEKDPVILKMVAHGGMDIDEAITDDIQEVMFGVKKHAEQYDG